MTHTTASLIGVVAVVVLDLAVLRTRLLLRRSYWLSYAIVLLFQLVTNEWLTSHGVFRYDPDAILGWRIGHAPVEDFLFGFGLVTSSMVWWVWWGRRGVQVDPPAEPLVDRLRGRGSAAPRPGAAPRSAPDDAAARPHDG